MKSLIFIFFLLTNIFSRKFRFFPNDRPIIGILSHRSYTSFYPPSEYSFIASSYVKFLESSGAQVVPIHYDSPEEELKMMLDKINGLLIPGGSAIETFIAGKYLLNLAIEKNLKGTYFPVWGTCLGHETIIIGIANDSNIMSKYNAHNVRLKLILRSPKKSKLYNSFDRDLVEYIQNEEVLYFSNDYALDIEVFNKNKMLKDFFIITSTVINNEGIEFISSIEGKYLPIYGVQYHPEKSPYEWSKNLDINRNPKAMRLSQNYGNFFVNEAKKNNQHFADKAEEHRYLIHQFSSIFVDSTYTECYFFKNRESL